MGSNTYVGAIEAFKHQVASVQRASLFDVTIADFAYGNAPGRLLKFSVKSATFPQATVGDVQVNYMGRVVHWYGDRNYSGTWATNIILDGGWQAYNAIYLWNQAMNGANRIVSQDINAHGYFKKDAYVTAYSTDGQKAHSVILKGMWPQDITELTMDWSTVDSAVELSVTWVYDYVVTDTSGTSASSSITSAMSSVTSNMKKSTSNNSPSQYEGTGIGPGSTTTYGGGNRNIQ